MVRNTCTILTGEEVHQSLLEGSRKIAEAVSTTFGPYGNNVAITMLYNLPHITKDGVTVANSISLPDQAEDVACQTIKRAASKTAEVAGDGTTSTTILANALVKNCFEYLKENPTKANELKKKLLDFGSKLEDTLESMKSRIETKDDIKNIALVSSNGDEEIANLITDAFDIIGKDGVVTVQESRSYNTYIDTTEGIKLDRSHISPMLENGKSKTVYEDPKILVTDMDFNSIQDAYHILNMQQAINSPLLVICNDLTGSALNVIAYAKSNNNLPIEFIRAPHIADARKEAVKDLAIITGGSAIMRDSGWNIEAVSVENLGSADSFEIGLKETNILGRKGDSKDIEERIAYYVDKIENDTDGLKENYKKRLAYFTSGASVIYVGGANEIEVQEKKDRIDDTIRAVRASMEEGIVPGGCMTYIYLMDALEELSETIEWKMYADSIKELVTTFLANAGVEATKENVEDLEKQVKENNIFDPSLVIKSTILNAIGAAIMIFTTNCIIIKHDAD